MPGIDGTDAPLGAKRAPRLAVLSGKGGVGKSNLALNLALALRDLGLRVLVVDCDLGLANVDVLLGLTPERTLDDMLDGHVTLDDTLMPVEDGLDILPATSGGAACGVGEERARALNEALSADTGHDIVLMDLGAGLSEGLVRLALLADRRLVVTTPEPTALTDAYALMKVLAIRLDVDDYWVAVNMVYEDAETDLVAERLVGACEHFLGFSPCVLGAVRTDPALPAAVCEQRPVLRASPACPAAADIRGLAKTIARRLQIDRPPVAATPPAPPGPEDNL